MEPDKKEKKKFNILDLFRNKQYFAILNLAVYSALILFLILSLRTPIDSDIESSNNQGNGTATDTQVVGFQEIKNKNFNFVYTLNLGEEVISYEGKEYEQKILFQDHKNNKEYFVRDDIFLVKQEEQYVLTESPCVYFNYLSVETLEKMLEAGIVDENDIVVPLADFLKIIEQTTQQDISEEEILITLEKSNQIITKITIDLSSYGQIIHGLDYEMSLVFEYSNFGLIEEFDVK